MPCAKAIMWTFRTQCKARNATGTPQSIKGFIATGKYFMNIALVTNIPNNVVMRRIKNAMKRYRKLDNAKIGGQMPTGLLNGFDKPCTNFVGKLR